MSNYAVAQQVLPLRLLAAQPFTNGWALATEDGTPYGQAFDVSQITDIKVIAEQRVSRGLTPPAPTIWTQSNSGGITLTTTLVGNLTFPYVELAGTAPAVGVYDVMLILVTAGGDDWVLSAVFDVSGEP